MYTAFVRLAAALLLALALGCGGDDDGPVDASAGSDGPVPASDGAAPADAAGGEVCTGSDDCGGEVCCEPGDGAGCVPTFDDCAGLVLCDGPDDCPPANPACCPQGFCGGCD